MNILQILYLEEKPANPANAVVSFVLYDGYWQFVNDCYSAILGEERISQATFPKQSDLKAAN
jgi:hypothetical protein